MDMGAAVKKDPFLESLPRPVAAKLKGFKEETEGVRIQVATDMADSQSFGERWLVVTDRRLFFISEEGADGTVEIPIDRVREVRTQELVGGGVLEVETEEGPPACLHYSSTLRPKFAEVADGIRHLSKGEELALPTEVERIRCEQCGRSASAQLVLPPNCKTFRMIQRQINKQAAPLVREWNAAEVAA